MKVRASGEARQICKARAFRAYCLYPDLGDDHGDRFVTALYDTEDRG